MAEADESRFAVPSNTKLRRSFILASEDFTPFRTDHRGDGLGTLVFR
jgi:hypothetical protein